MRNRTVLNYTLQRLLGKGGMAEVWYAENEIGNVAAVKILNEDLSHNVQIVERFRNEAKITVKLKHANIRQVYDYATIDGRPCMIMEYLEGADLKAMMQEGRRFSDTELRRWWNQLASALNYTHGQGVVHRDIKPSNIFITAEGDVKLLDFGIAKVQESITMTQTGSMMGTLIYMSPEQVMDAKHIGHTTDLYSLAVTFVHLLQGHAPYDKNASNDYEIRKSIVEMPLDLSGIPADWQNFLQPYLAKNPTDRPALTAFKVSSTPSASPTGDDASEGTQVDDGEHAEAVDEETRVVLSPTPEQEEKTPEETSESGKKNHMRRIWLWLMVVGGAAEVLSILLIRSCTSTLSENNYNYNVSDSIKACNGDMNKLTELKERWMNYKPEVEMSGGFLGFGGHPDSTNLVQWRSDTAAIGRLLAPAAPSGEVTPNGDVTPPPDNTSAINPQEIKRQEIRTAFWTLYNTDRNNQDKWVNLYKTYQDYYRNPYVKFMYTITTGKPGAFSKFLSLKVVTQYNDSGLQQLVDAYNGKTTTTTTPTTTPTTTTSTTTNSNISTPSTTNRKQ